MSQACDWKKAGPLVECDPHTPLDGRQPLLLVHGIAPYQDAYFNWSHFIDYARQYPAFDASFKIYLLHFEPESNTQEAAAHLLPDLHQLLEREAITSLQVMCNSLGGLVYRELMRDPALAAATHQVISVGVPHHGTVLANPDWVLGLFRQNSLRQKLIRTLFRQGFRKTKKMYPDYRQIYCWENYELNAQYCPVPISHTDYPHAKLSPELQDRFVAYGSFFGISDPLHTYLLDRLALTINLPAEKLTPQMLYFKHGLLSLGQKFLMNQTRDTLLKSYRTLAVNPPLLPYSDGIASIASTLWLGRYFTPQAPDTIQQQSWQTLASLRKMQTARLFAGLDHRNWMEGDTRTERTIVSDLLHPGLKARSVFDWYLYDLFRGVQQKNADPESGVGQKQKERAFRSVERG